MHHDFKVYAYLFHPDYFACRSGMHKLAEYVGAEVVEYGLTWKELSKKSWTLGYLARRVGQWLSGSEWNATVPWVDERSLLNRVQRDEASIVHFIYGEFTMPKLTQAYHRRGAKVVTTYHASVRKLPTVLKGGGAFERSDWITLMSETQKSFFMDRGYPEERLRVILHGVDTDYFRPSEQQQVLSEGPVRGLLVGVTERDHEFAAAVARASSPDIFHLSVSTALGQRVHYEGVENVTLLDHMPDEVFLEAYQHADVVFMPMLDCTANNVILEAMACGTPIMTNKVGGIPEYVDDVSSIIMDEKHVADWVDVLRTLHGEKESLAARRSAVRTWAERFSWPKVAKQFQELYLEMLSA